MISDYEYIKSLLKDRLSKKRYVHSVNVAAAAKSLAENYGENADRAYLAGLVHDICKEEKLEKLKKYILKCSNITNEELASEKLWHGPAGAYYIQKKLQIYDEDIINAVRFHTVGRSGMSKLEEIVYLADLISDDRDFKDVDKMRRLAYSDINKAMLEAISYSMSNVIKKQGYIPVYSLEAYNQYNYLYLARKKSKEKK